MTADPVTWLRQAWQERRDSLPANYDPVFDLAVCDMALAILDAYDTAIERSNEAFLCTPLGAAERAGRASELTRLLPVLARPVADDTMPEELR